MYLLLGLQFCSIDLLTCPCTRLYNYCSVVELGARDVDNPEVCLLLRINFAILRRQEWMGGSVNTLIEAGEMGLEGAFREGCRKLEKAIIFEM